MRDRYDEIQELGAEVVAIGTGDAAAAGAFVEAQGVPFPVLADEDARAAKAAQIARVGFLRLFDPASFPGGLRAWRGGHRIGASGRRVDQLGATFVLGPGSVVHYEHRDDHTADHAPMDELLHALAGR